MKNIILIGMPGCGKSTIGVLLAKAMGFRFIDTDITIQNRTGMLLQQIIDQKGLDWFCIEEERAIMSVEESGGCVIATGGSAVYSRSAMMYLKEHGYVYYLALPVEPGREAPAQHKDPRHSNAPRGFHRGRLPQAPRALRGVR